MRDLSSRIWYRASRIACLVSLLVLSLLCVPSFAHEACPAYFEAKETAPGRFSVLWRTPVLSGMRLPVVLKLPDDVQNVQEPAVQELADSLVERRWIDAGPNGLAGKRIEFVGLQLMSDRERQVCKQNPMFVTRFRLEAVLYVLESL